MARYNREEIPETVSWIRSLNATQAIEQCRALGITPAGRLEDNRVALRRFVEGNRQARPEPRIPEEAESTQSLAWDGYEDLINFSTQTSNVEARRRNTSSQTLPNQTLPSQTLPSQTLPNQTLPSQNSQPSETKIPDVMLKQLHELTMQAVSQTAQAFAAASFSNQRSETGVPHFVRQMLKDLPTTDGQNVKQTMQFLKGVDKILRLKLAGQKDILLGAASNTEEPFRQFWVESVAEEPCFEQILAKFRECFLTPERLRLAQNDMLYRVQGNSEKLAQYVQDMELNYNILAPHTSSETVFQTVFCRINRETRNSLAGLGAILTLSDLISASPIAESVMEQQFRNRDAENKPAYPRQLHAAQPRNDYRAQGYQNSRYMNRSQQHGSYRQQPGNNNYGQRQQYRAQQGPTLNYSTPQYQFPPPQFPYPPPPLPQGSTTTYYQSCATNGSSADGQPNMTQNSGNLNYRARK